MSKISLLVAISLLCCNACASSEADAGSEQGPSTQADASAQADVNSADERQKSDTQDDAASSDSSTQASDSERPDEELIEGDSESPSASDTGALNEDSEGPSEDIEAPTDSSLEPEGDSEAEGDVEVPLSDVVPSEDVSSPSDSSPEPEGDIENSLDAEEDSSAEADSAEDTASEEDADTGEEDVVDVEDGPPPPLDPCPATITITSPSDDDFFVLSAPMLVTAQLSELTQDPLGLMVQWEGPSGVVLGQTPLDPEGNTSGMLDISSMPLGLVPIYARIVSEQGACAETSEVKTVLCQQSLSEDFDESLDAASWKVFGSSYWDQGGWLEITGTAQGQRGAIYNTAANVASGSVSISFAMATGGGTGADGFAMTVVQTDSVDELENLIIANAVPGSGLGYAVGGPYGNWEGNAFTVEIDTYQNVFNGTNELHTDPTPNDHVAITLDGDAGNHIWWTDVGDVEDLTWRDIRVDVIGIRIRVWIDGVLTLDDDYPELQFRGGYIFFSGSTGYYTNYHRFDALNIIHTCQTQ